MKLHVYRLWLEQKLMVLEVVLEILLVVAITVVPQENTVFVNREINLSASKRLISSLYLLSIVYLAHELKHPTGSCWAENL